MKIAFYEVLEIGVKHWNAGIKYVFIEDETSVSYNFYLLWFYICLAYDTI